MIFREDDLVVVKALPGLLWRVFELTQINTVTLRLWYQPAGYEPPSDQVLLFKVLKSGELADQDDLCSPDQTLLDANAKAALG